MQATHKGEAMKVLVKKNLKTSEVYHWGDHCAMIDGPRARAENYLKGYRKVKRKKARALGLRPCLRCHG
jgi:hypothetical protein